MTGGYVSGLFQHIGKFALWDRIFFYYFFNGREYEFFSQGAVYASIAISRLGHKNTTL
jgi:hypothetical protein